MAITSTVPSPTAQSTLPTADTVTCAEDEPTAAVVESRSSVAGTPWPKLQPVVTSVSKSGLVTRSGPVPSQIIWE